MKELQNLTKRQLSILVDRNQSQLFKFEIGCYNGWYLFDNGYYTIKMNQENLLNLIDILDSKAEIQRVVKSWFVQNLNTVSNIEPTLWSVFKALIDNKNKSIKIDNGGNPNRYDNLTINNWDNHNCEHHDFITSNKEIKKEKEAANKSDIVITENKQGGYRLFYNKKEKLLISFKFDYIFDFIEGPYYFKYLENYTIKKPFLTNKNKQIIIVPSVNMLVNNVYKKIEIKENNKVLIKE